MPPIVGCTNRLDVYRGERFRRSEFNTCRKIASKVWCKAGTQVFGVLLLAVRGARHRETAMWPRVATRRPMAIMSRAQWCAAARSLPTCAVDSALIEWRTVSPCTDTARAASFGFGWHGWPVVDRPFAGGIICCRPMTGRGLWPTVSRCFSTVGSGMSDKRVSVVEHLESGVTFGPVSVHPVKNVARKRSSAIGGSLIAAVAVLGACGASNSSRDASTSSVDVAVIAAWKASLYAYDSAARTSNPNSPGLAATHVEPELTSAEKNLALERSDKAIATGNDHVLRVRVVSLSGKTASVAACVNGREIFVNEATRQPVPGVLGQAGIEGSNATMLLTPEGWKLERQTVTEGRCS